MNKQTTDHGVPFGEAMKVWARVAALSFGGPAGQIAVMHRIIVEEKRWIGENRFLQALNYCTLLPGPEAQQLAIYIGWLMHKTKGGLFAGTLFVLPGLIAIMALSWIYVLLGKLTIVEGLFFGLKAAVLVVVVEAVLRVGKRALKNNVMVALAAISFVAIFFYDVPFPIIVFGAGIIGYVAGRAGLEPFLAGGGHGKVGAKQVADREFAARRGDARPCQAQSALVALHHRRLSRAMAGARGRALSRPGRRQRLHQDRDLLQPDGRRHLRRRLCRVGLCRPAGGRELSLGDSPARCWTGSAWPRRRPVR